MPLIPVVVVAEQTHAGLLPPRAHTQIKSKTPCSSYTLYQSGAFSELSSPPALSGAFSARFRCFHVHVSRRNQMR